DAPAPGVPLQREAVELERSHCEVLQLGKVRGVSARQHQHALGQLEGASAAREPWWPIRVKSGVPVQRALPQGVDELDVVGLDVGTVTVESHDVKGANGIQLRFACEATG